MKRVLIAAFLLAIAAFAFYALKGSFPGFRAPSPETDAKVAKLEGLYQQTEEIEAKIRAHQSQGRKYDTEQHALDLLRESIESLRGEIRQQGADETGPAAPSSATTLFSLEKIKQIPRSVVLAGAGILAVIILTALISVLRRQLFGMKMRPKPFTQAIPATRKARPSPEIVRAPVPVEEETLPDPKNMPDRKMEEILPAKAARTYERMAASGTQNEQIVDLYRQGLTIKEISNRLKISLDQVALVVRLQSKD